MEEQRQSNVDFDDAETLRKKLKSFKDVYRSERNKVIKSMKSGAGTDDIYKPKLACLVRQSRRLFEKSCV